MEQISRYFPYGVVVVAILALMAMMAPPHDAAKGMRLMDVGELPVLEGGRVKPLEGYARTVLMQVSSRQSWRDGNDDKRPAVQWLFESVTGGGHDEAIKQAE